MRASLALLLAPLMGCGIASDLIRVQVEGSVDIDGTAPAAYSLQLYTRTDNTDAFDTSYCLDGDDQDCFGRVDVSKLDTPAESSDGGALPVEWDGTDFTISDVPADLLYVLVATGDDGSVQCSSDVVGFNEDTKVVDSSSAITLSVDGGAETFTLPRDVRLTCAPAATEPDPPGNDPGGETGGDDIAAGDDPESVWSDLVITPKSSGSWEADASTGNATADVACDDSFPAVLNIKAFTVDTSVTSAWLRIQFGAEDKATYRNIEVPVRNGEVNENFSLTGGYAVVQLDTDDQLDGAGESYTVSFCDKADPPAQEMLVLLSWDQDDTDLDTHVYSANSEVAYYSMRQSWGELDIDDINGYGPETFTSTPETSGNLYEVKVHYYSDHGNGPATATVRVVYFDDSTGETCDVTTSQTMSSYDWWTVGAFGPGLACPD